MSALTDLFTALANKIRSKTGGSDTYTPPQMVNAIDDVYDAGVAAGTKPTQTKSAGPNVSTNKDITPDSGYLLSKVTITPLSHTGTYTPAANTAANDMGANHDNRYVNTSGMIVPSGNKSITANGTGIDVSGYATASVNVPNPTLSGDAAVGNVLSGKTFYNSTYTKQTGTMTNRGAVSQALNCGGSYTVPEGYHNGSGTVTANSLASQTGVDSGKTAIDASHVHSGYQGWVNGSKVSGSYTPPTISSITPDNANPVSLATGNNYSPTTTGYAVKTVPSGTLPADSITSNGTHTISGLRDYVAVTFTVNVPASSTTTGSYSNSDTGTVTSKTQTFNAAKTGYTLIGAAMKKAQVYSAYVNDNVCNWQASVSVSGNTISLTMKSNNTRTFRCNSSYCQITAFYVAN